MLTNPNYLKDLSLKLAEENSYYEDAYKLYEQGNYSESIRKIDEALVKFPVSKLESQYHLLKAMCIGKTSDLRSFRNSLNEVAEKYPKTEVSERALSILEYIRRQELQLTTDDVTNATVDTVKITEKQQVEYKKPQGEHLVVILVPKKTNLNQLKFNIVSFNVDVFINLDLEVSNQPFNDFFELIKVSGLKDSQQAMEYFDAVSHKEGLFNPLNPQDYTSFIISQENFTLFIEDKSLADYLKFFNSNYK
jgi:tetratricopeptide (TPR) repeat protein